MKINTNNNCIGAGTVNFGSRKIPRFLYHFTTEDNYKMMQKQGFIEASMPPMDPVFGVFMVEINNFIRHWNSKKVIGEDLRERLALYLSQKNQNIVALRVSTKNLDKNKLKLRSQLFVFKNQEKLIDEFEKSYSNPEQKYSKFRHFFEGDSAEKFPIYRRKKEAIEFFYPENIGIHSIEKVGDLQNASKKTTNKFFKKLLLHQAEEKALVNWKA